MLAEPTFVALRADAWAALAACALTLIAVVTAAIAGWQLRLSREIKDEQTRPYIIVDFHFRSVMISLSVKNIGQTPASNVRVILDGEMVSAVMGDVAWQTSPLFQDKVPLFAPGREMRFVLDMFHERVQKKLPMTVQGTVEYWRFGPRGEKLSEPFTIDLSGFSEALLPPKDISDLVDEAEKIRKLVEQMPRQ